MVIGASTEEPVILALAIFEATKELLWEVDYEAMSPRETAALEA
jgi:hypothetical protein